MTIVTNISTKSVNTKFGAKNTYQVTCDDGVAYSLGFTKPSFKVGDSIEFVPEEDKYGMKMDPKTVRVTGSGGAAAPTPAAAPRAAGGGSYAPRPFPIPLLHGDRSIVRQNALTNARETCVAYWEKHAWPATSNGVAEEILALAREFEAYTAGDIERRAAEEEK